VLKTGTRRGVSAIFSTAKRKQFCNSIG
jgi:hypothetical protein